MNTSMPGVATDRSAAEDYEELRLDALGELGLIDTPENECYDRVTRMASVFLQAPISAISLTDRNRQWFKSHVGTAGRELPRVGAPCAQVTQSQRILHVPDLLLDERFFDSPLALSGARFYAGAPLTTREGFTLGAMCVVDNKPRVLSPDQLKSLEDMAAIVMAQIELQHAVGRIDPLSGLPNKNQLFEDIEDQAQRYAGEGRVLLVIELTDLRHLNEAVSVLGTTYLDEMVKMAARQIKAERSRRDGFYHVGFAKLALLLDEESEPWLTLVERLIKRFGEPVRLAGIPVTIAAAYGVSPIQLGSVTAHDALRTAVSAAHDARIADLDYAVYSVASEEALKRRFYLLSHLRSSLEQTLHFHLVYQPRLDLHTGKCLSAEALLRWAHPLLGNVSPGEFIPVIEQTALAGPMTQWVLTKAMQQLKLWREQGNQTRLSINISARNLEEADFADSVALALRRHGLKAADIELEFTESALIRHASRVFQQLNQIRDLGVELAIDDFGTGYSSFTYLQKLPATTVKLDQSFMPNVTRSEKDRTLVHSMIGMAHKMGYRVVAEGVETAEVLDFLRECGCDEIQGYYIARPLSASDFDTFIRRATQLGYRLLETVAGKQPAQSKRESGKKPTTPAAGKSRSRVVPGSMSLVAKEHTGRGTPKVITRTRVEAVRSQPLGL